MERKSKKLDQWYNIISILLTSLLNTHYVLNMIETYNYHLQQVRNSITIRYEIDQNWKFDIFKIIQ